MARKYKEIYEEVIKSSDEVIGKIIGMGIAECGIDTFDEPTMQYMKMVNDYYKNIKKLMMEQAAKMDEMADQISDLTKINSKLDKLIDQVSEIKKKEE